MITIEISGPVGCGKTAFAEHIRDNFMSRNDKHQDDACCFVLEDNCANFDILKKESTALLTGKHDVLVIVKACKGRKTK